MDLTQAVADSSAKAQAPKSSAKVNRDAYPVASEDFDAPGGVARIVTRAATGAHMIEYQPDAGKLQRIDLAAVPAVGFAVLTDEHRSALADLFPDDFGTETTHEPSSN